MDPKRRLAPTREAGWSASPPSALLQPVDLEVDVRLLTELLEPGLGLLVHLAAPQLPVELFLHLRERLEIRLLGLGHLKHVEALRSAHGSAHIPLLHRKH